MFLAMITVAATTAGGIFTEYPVFVNPDTVVEAVVDRGLISELIVKCNGGTAILSFSKIEHVYCTPRKGCFNSFPGAYQSTCGSSK